MAAPSYVFTIRRVAMMLGEDEQTPEEIAEEMEPEGGRLGVIDLDDEISTTAMYAPERKSLTEAAG